MFNFFLNELTAIFQWNSHHLISPSSKLVFKNKIFQENNTFAWLGILPGKMPILPG